MPRIFNALERKRIVDALVNKTVHVTTHHGGFDVHLAADESIYAFGQELSLLILQVLNRSSHRVTTRYMDDQGGTALVCTECGVIEGALREEVCSAA